MHHRFVIMGSTSFSRIRARRMATTAMTGLPVERSSESGRGMAGAIRAGVMAAGATVAGAMDAGVTDAGVIGMAEAMADDMGMAGGLGLAMGTAVAMARGIRLPRVGRRMLHPALDWVAHGPDMAAAMDCVRQEAQADFGRRMAAD